MTIIGGACSADRIPSSEIQYLDGRWPNHEPMTGRDTRSGLESGVCFVRSRRPCVLG